MESGGDVTMVRSVVRYNCVNGAITAGRLVVIVSRGGAARGAEVVLAARNGVAGDESDKIDLSRALLLCASVESRGITSLIGIELVRPLLELDGGGVAGASVVRALPASNNCLLIAVVLSRLRLSSTGHAVITSLSGTGFDVPVENLLSVH